MIPVLMPPPEELPETTIHVRRAIEGDEASLSWLVERLSPLLLAQVSYRLGPTLRALYDPQDLVQEAWLTLLPRLHELPERDGRHTPGFLRFLGTTLLNKVNTLVQKHLGAGRRSAGTPTDGWSAVAVDDSGVVTLAIRKETRNVVLRHIDSMDEQDREILLMRGIEQQRNQTVALVLGLTPQAVAMRYRRALERLREQLPGSVFEELED